MRRTDHQLAFGSCLLDLIVVVVLFVLILLIVIPTFSRAKNLARLAACQANLHGIGKSIGMYSDLSNHREPFPLLRTMGDPNAGLGKTTTSKDIWSSDLGTNSMQNVWLLEKEEMVSTSHFHCPEDPSWTPIRHEYPSTATSVPTDMTHEDYGWGALTEFSYGMHFPYDADQSGTTNPARLSNRTLPSDFVIFADRNPGRSVGDGQSPSNHPIDGQAILLRDGSVKVHRDSRAGAAGDDVYVNSNGVAGGLPTTASDTSISPVPSR